MLFNKHLGQEDNTPHEIMGVNYSDLRELQDLSTALVHDMSDGCVSSNYPNSSFSTFRENTFSSFSSMVVKEDEVAAVQINNEGVEEQGDSETTESSVKETTSGETADSERKETIIETKELEDTKKVEEDPEKEEHKRPVKAWGQANISNVERKFMLQQKRMQDYFKQKNSDKWQQSLSTETDMSSTCFNNKEGEEDVDPVKVEIIKPPTPKIRKEKSPEKLVKSEIAKELEPKKLVIPMQEVLKRPVPRPVTAPIFKRPSFIRDKESVASSIQSHVSGVYTNEYLTRARKFGAVVGALRKPGHHIGPAKNPDCVCEHCTRWFEEKCKGRGRANSITNAPLTFEGFRARRLQQ